MYHCGNVLEGIINALARYNRPTTAASHYAHDTFFNRKHYQRINLAPLQ